MAKKKTIQQKKEFKNKEEVMAEIEKKYGSGAITFGAGPVLDIPSISTGSATLDSALGVWGIPKGRIVEVYGPEGSGKTTLCLSIVKECQKVGGIAAFVDAEHALDPKWAEKIGVDVDNLMISQPSSGEEALTIVEMLATSKQVDLVVVDSVAALTPQAEIDGELGEAHIGAQARLMSQAMRKLVAGVKRSNCIVVFINQIRMKIGVMFGNPEVTPGGRALKFYSSVRLDIRRSSAIKKGDEHLGNMVKIKVVKNKVAPPFKVAECALYFGKDGDPSGIDYAASLVELARDAGVIEVSGSWYSFDELRLGNGSDNAYAFVREDEKVAKQILSKVMELRAPKKVEDKGIKDNIPEVVDNNNGLEEFE